MKLLKRWIKQWWYDVTELTGSLTAVGGEGRHRHHERALTPMSYKPRHLASKTETRYKTPGRATNHGSWGDEPTQPWSIIPPRDQWAW